MAAQRYKKNVGRNVFVFLNAYKPKTELIKSPTLFILPDHMEDYCKIQNRRL